MNGQRSEIRENGWIEIEDQALETGPKEAEAPSRVNGAGNGANGSFLRLPARVVTRRPRSIVMLSVFSGLQADTTLCPKER